MDKEEFELLRFLTEHSSKENVNLFINIISERERLKGMVSGLSKGFDWWRNSLEDEKERTEYWINRYEELKRREHGNL